jgi:uncharacterized C2H2 Zn-finger protein
VIGQLYYCPQCDIVYLKFPDVEISTEGQPKRTLRDQTGYLQCQRCSGEYSDEKVELKPIASPSHVLVNK